MTNRITKAPVRTLALTALMASLAGCGMINSVINADKVDYRNSTKARPLDVPPDLTQLEKDNRYAVPDVRGVATASGMQQQPGQAQAGVVAATGMVGPVSSEDMRIERAGNQRWLVVRQAPELVWPQLKQFWEENGFPLVTESQATGVMETEWVENRSKIPEDFIRRSIGKIADGLYSTGERDKYRTRVERGADGSTEIYISHRGAEEVLTGSSKEIPAWTVRPNDPGLEAQYLAKLMAKLGKTEEKQAETVVATATAAPQPQHATLAGDTVTLDEGYDRAWRRVGLALDRVGFTVEDRDRVQGIYFVRFVDETTAKKKGFFGRLFNLSSESDKEAQRFRVVVKAVPGSATSQVNVQDKDGKPETSATGAKILKLLVDELK
ncbi:MAG TPA: outer membrane protein assembly factor BamC [Telluria sp.]|nr:outer membrane protein assembly factor BamC [Telluria sp.]